jgi:hypothetical protein
LKKIVAGKSFVLKNVQKLNWSANSCRRSQLRFFNIPFFPTALRRAKDVPLVYQKISTIRIATISVDLSKCQVRGYR